MPKLLGRWVVKNIFWFSKALVEKSLWRLAHNSMLWGRVMSSKYFPGMSMVGWFREPNKYVENCSIVWKSML
jgi:hypothetical protein